MLTVRPGKPGWIVGGIDPKGKRVRIVLTTRGAALHVRDKLENGLKISALDYQPRGTE